MGVKKPTPRNPKALAGIRLRGAVPNSYGGIGIFKDSPSLLNIQEQWGTGDDSCP